MHIYVNTREGRAADGYVELICRGNELLGTQCSLIER